MFRPRVIPVLLLRGGGLVKTEGFGKQRYIGDPINAVRIFNDHRADELVFLDILATRERRLISLDFVRNVGEEANMPFAVGGGIRSLQDIRNILSAGAEKVVLNSVAAENPDFISEAADSFGSSTITVCIDVKPKRFGGPRTWTTGGTRATGYAPEEFGRLAEEKGAGEIIVQSITRDGTMEGYDLDLISWSPTRSPFRSWPWAVPGGWTTSGRRITRLMRAASRRGACSCFTARSGAC